MVTAEDALKLIRQHPVSFKTEKKKLLDSSGYYLANDVFADRDFPPFDRVTMDGIAINYQSYAEGNRTFPVQEIAQAGKALTTLKNKNECIEVMTGSILPVNTDTIIRYEDLEIKKGIAYLSNVSIKSGQNIHIKGSDNRKGDLLIEKKKMINPQRIAVMASVGLDEIDVIQYPPIAIISSGDEIIPVNQVPLLHQIRSSNAEMLLVTLQSMKIHCDRFHFNDDQIEIREGIKNLLDKYDVMLFIGGSSKGKYDFIPETLSELGIQKVFYRIRQKPGKPLWFGHRDNEKFVFAFPGNPVSAFVCFQFYFRHWFLHSLGLNFEYGKAVLNSDVYFKPDLLYFAQSKISENGTKMTAEPILANGSGDLNSLIDANAFLILPRGKEIFRKGEEYPYLNIL